MKQLRCGTLLLATIIFLFLGAVGGCAYISTNSGSDLSGILGGATMANKTLVDNISEPLNGASNAKFEITTASGNLTIDRHSGGEAVLATGALEYLDGLEPPRRSLTVDNSEATLALTGSGARKSWFSLPWSVCNGAFEWQIHVNPTVPADITAHTGGGNVRLNLVGMILTRLSADAGGGNMDVILPDNSTNLNVVADTGGGNVSVEIGSGMSGSNIVNAHSGAGNVIVRLPRGIAARLEATSGMGKVIVDPRFQKLDRNIYQSPEYDSSTDRVEIKVHSGAGNVSILSR